ncbi:MAG: TetR/AcrR family transcriptional regulator [Actinomycetota bacterium]|nr:MAG: TetR/AcrR family transcriptional regulator [Actinomycetota bacterium]
MSRTGRRPGAPETSEAILRAARRAFGDRGYEAATFRSIAEDAGVDPALLVHYFGSKEELFAAALNWPVHPVDIFGGLETSNTTEMAEMIVRRYLSMLDQPQVRDAILAMVRSAVSNERAARMLREFVTEEILAILGRITSASDSELRASMVASQLVGIAMLRHVVRLQALVEATTDEIAVLVAPAIAGYLR